MKIGRVLRLVQVPLQVGYYRTLLALGLQTPGPLSVSIYATNACNSRCTTCNIWKHKPQNELSLSAWKRVFRSLGSHPIWFTITGGEPFLRPDLVRMVALVCKYNKPLYLNIPTNGLEMSAIKRMLPKILEACKKSGTSVTINASIDGIDEQYDAIRGVKGGFSQVSKTIALLKKIQTTHNNLNIGINITISSHNVHQFPEIYKTLKKRFAPDSLVAEVATHRKSFFLQSEKLTPDAEAYDEALAFMLHHAHPAKNSTANLIQRLRRGYYQFARDLLHKQGDYVPCRALAASVELLSDGSMINCCALAESVGNVKSTNYDALKLWNSKQARKIRNAMRKRKCSCTLVNPYYTNRLLK